MKRTRSTKKPFYNKWWFWLLAILVVVAFVGSQGGDKDEASTDKPKSDATLVKKSANKSSDGATQTETSKNLESSSKAANVPTDHANALIRAKRYASRMHMSKQRVSEQLTSEYGEKFSETAAKYAIDNLKGIDWNANALAKGTTYAKRMKMSKQKIFDQLTSQYGEKFTEQEGQYAVDNLKNIDWNANALVKAKRYQNNQAMSPDRIRDQLTSEYGEKFTVQEADYAIQHLND